MRFFQLVNWRFIVLAWLWVLPFIFYLVIGLIALYQNGWMPFIAWSLPVMWLLAWLVGRLWVATKLNKAALSQPLTAPEFWTPQDAAAIKVVEEFRKQVSDVDQVSIADPNRYFCDAQALTQLLAKHYQLESSGNVFHSLTIVEILAVVHLSIEDIENWVVENVPGGNLATVGQLERLPKFLAGITLAQKTWFLGSAIINPSKILTYPLWSKAGLVATELQNEIVRGLYQFYLRQVSYYLIEMYSGRLRAGSTQYRKQFGHMAKALHISGVDASVLSGLKDISTTIAVMGQVKAGKSSLINALMKDKVAESSILPETRKVKRLEYRFAESLNVFSLLDTPGYGEANVSKEQLSEIKSASQAADIILLVLAANSPAREADVQMVHEIGVYYRKHPSLRPPPIIAILTHIDLVRPMQEWSPPYDWRQPTSAKETSIANAVAYARDIFGGAIAAYACVYTGETHIADSSVADEVVPQLMNHLSQGHAAAVLKAFYQQLSQKRFQQLSRQAVGLIKTAVKNISGGT